MFRAALILLSLALATFAQSIAIGAPLHGTALVAGQNFTVEVDRPNTITGSMEVGIVIALRACASIQCSNVPSDKAMGTVLYTGPYLPKFYAAFNPPHENFTVYLPEAFEKGTAQLNVVHFSLVGAGPDTLYESKSVTVSVM